MESRLGVGSDEVEKEAVVTVVDDPWLVHVRKRLESVGDPRNGRRSSETSHCFICRVPKSLVEVRPNAFRPHQVSIGPYHHGEPHLQPMEEVKWQLLKSIVERNETTIDALYSKIHSLAPRAMACYDEFPSSLNQRDFSLMMLLDGCFIIEVLNLVRSHSGNDDTSVKIRRLAPLILADFVKLENQIPLFILRTLLHLKLFKNNEFGLFSEFAQGFAYDLMMDMGEGTKINHLLGLFSRNCYLCVQNPLIVRVPSLCSWREKVSRLPKSAEPVACATKLQRAAGITFKARNTYSSILDIRFRNGVLEIPPIALDDQSATLLLNCVALEQCFPTANHHYYSAYSVFMDMLINTKWDVALLCEKRIIDNYFNTEDDVACFFNTLGKVISVDLKPCPLAGVLEQLNEDYRNKWKKLRTGFMYSYCKTPWLVISTIAAVILLILSLLQLIFGILSWQTQV